MPWRLFLVELAVEEWQRRWCVDNGHDEFLGWMNLVSDAYIDPNKGVFRDYTFSIPHVTIRAY